jgi:6-phosphogluconate dehydrogenase (decarboxylating)
VGKSVLRISGNTVTAWITVPGSQQTSQAYEHLDADVIVGSLCVDAGGAEYGVASQANRAVIEQIMVTLRPIA